MSNVSRVTPYATSEQSPSAVSQAMLAATGMCAIATAKGVVTLAKWLSEETPDEKHTRKQLREAQLLGLVRSNADVHIERNPLHLKDAASLVRSAETLGYRVEQKMTLGTNGAEPLILLQRERGERLAIHQNKLGSIDLYGVGASVQAPRVLRQHSLDCAIRHIESLGQKVHVHRLNNGDVEVKPERPVTKGIGSAPALSACVKEDGSALVDVDCVQGSQCEAIAQDFARAIGGRITHMNKKQSFYELPGEPARVKQERVR